MADLRQRVQIEASLKDKGASRGLDNIKGKSEAALGDKTGLAAHATKAKIAFAALGVGVAAAAVGITRMVTEVARQNDEIAKLSTRLGASTEALSQYRFVAERSGVTFETFTMGLQRMTRRVAEAAQGTGEAVKALKELNISAADLARMRPEDQYERIADAIHGLSNQSDRVRLAMKLFDSEGVALVQTMTAGAEGIRELREEADALGITLSGDAAAAAEKFNDQLTNMQAATDGLKLAFSEGLVGALGDFETSITSPGMRDGMRDFGGLLGKMANAAFQAAAGLGMVARDLGLLDDQTEAQKDFFATAEYLDEELARRRDKGLLSPTEFALGESTGLADVFTAATGGSGDSGGGNATIDLFGNKFGSGKKGHVDPNKDEIVKIFEERGRLQAQKQLLAYKTQIEKDKDVDIYGVNKDAGYNAAESFLDSLEPALTAGMADFILEGDLKDATKLFGATLVGGMVVDASHEFSSKIVNGLKDVDGTALREDLIDAGQGIGRKLSEGIELSFSAISIPGGGLADKFGPEGSVGKTIATKFGETLQAGLLGAGLADVFGQSRVGGAIGAALGQAIAGPIGAAIGGVGGGFLASFFGNDLDKKDERDAARNLSAVLQGQGGLNNLIDEAGGAANLRGHLTDKGFGRLSSQISRGQVTGVLRQLLIAQGATGTEADRVIDKIISGESGGGVGDIDLDPKGIVPPADDPPPGSGNPGGHGGSLAAQYLSAVIGSKRISKSGGIAAAALGGGASKFWPKVADLLNSDYRAYAPIGGTIKAALRGDHMTGGNLHSARQYGFDIVAASGFHGTLTQPTAILAGENGPERVDITPSGSDYVGGGRGRGGVSAHFSVNINALDINGVDAAAERLVDRVRSGLLEMSERGEPVIYDSGVVSPPRV